MHIASFMYMAFILYIFIARRKIKKIFVELVALYAFTYISVEAGNFIDTFGISFGYARFVELFMLLLAIIILVCYFVHGRLALPRLFPIGLSLFCVMIGMIGLILRPADVLVVNGGTLIDSVWNGKAALQYPAFSKSTVTSFIAYLLFLLVLYAIFLALNFDDYFDIIKKFVKYSKILIVFGYIEFLVKLFISSQLYSNLMILFWGASDAVVYSDELRNGLPMLYGWTQEPSHFAYTLFVIMVVMLAQDSIDRNQLYWIIAAELLLILTMAFSAFLFAFTFMAIVYIYRKKEAKHYLGRMIGIFGITIVTIIVICTVVLSGVFAGSFFGDRIMAIIEELPLLLKLDIQNISELEYSSYRVRLVSSFTTLKLFIYRQLFGIGIGTLA